MLKHNKSFAIILTSIFLFSLLGIATVFTLTYESLTPTVETESGEIKEIQLIPDLTGSVSMDISFPFNAYAFKWGDDSSFLYSWDGETFAKPETIRDSNGEEGNFSEMQFGSIRNNHIYVKSATANEITLLLFNTASASSIEPFANILGASTAEAASLSGVVNRSSGIDISNLDITTRAEWGADESLMNWTPEYWPVNKIIIHHTVWSNTTNYASVVRAIYLYHTVTLGWGDIAYNYLIAPDGTIYEGRAGGAETIGGHAYGENAGSIGIALIGNFELAEPTKASRDALKELLLERSLLHGIELSWKETIFGHKDMPGSVTACPGSYLHGRLPNIVAIVEEKRLVNLETNPIANARNATEVALQNYLDVRLKLNFSNQNLTLQQAKAIIPVSSEIESVTELTESSAIIEVRSFSNYYGTWKDHTLDRVSFLYTLFSLDPEIESIELLSSPALVSSKPSKGGFYINRPDIYFDFSRSLSIGSGNIRVKNYLTDEVLEVVSVNSSSTSKIADRRFRISLSSELAEGSKYYLTICETCFIDANGETFPGTLGKDTWSFTVNPPHLQQSEQDSDGVADFSFVSTKNELKIDRSKNGFTGWDAKFKSYGGSNFQELPGDYDGDGIDDYAGRTSSGEWRIDYAKNGFTGWDFVKGGYASANAVATVGDYDGDGKLDLSVRNQGGNWLIDFSANGYNGWDRYSSNHGSTATTVVPADYDGDGLTDMAIRSRSGTWRIDYAKNGFTGWDKSVGKYGGSTAKALPADYDGDGKTDISIRTPRGRWLIDYARNGFGAKDVIKLHLGGIKSIPVPADYDGDGKTDLAIKKPNGEWFIDYRSNGFRGWDIKKKGFGGSKARPAVGDYDGDGKLDLAIRTNNGLWKIDYSIGGYKGIDASHNDLAGTALRALPMDYDGDGKTDISTANNEGYWFLDKSSNGFSRPDIVLGGYKGANTNSDYDGDGATDISARAGRNVFLIDYHADGLGVWNEILPGYPTGGYEVSADYDGDGRSDIAIFAAGIWSLDVSENGFGTWSQRVVNLGGYQVAAPGDFDADGKFDIAFKNNDGVIAIDLATNGFGVIDSTLTGRGNNSAKLSIMDFDGDRRYDISTLDRSGNWRIDFATNGFGVWDKIYRGYGKNVIIVEGDYDGDSIADLSIRDGDRWLVDNSNDGFGLWDLSYWIGF